jgi:hypothetical protein
MLESTYKVFTLIGIEQPGGGWRVELGRSLVARRFRTMDDALAEVRLIVDRGLLDGALGQSIAAPCGQWEKER